MMTPIPAGTSEPYDVQLYDDGVALVGTGFDVELVIIKANGDAVGSPAPTAAWLSQAGGTVRITGHEVLERGEYAVRFKLTDTGNNEGYAPTLEWETWEILQRMPGE